MNNMVRIRPYAHDQRAEVLDTEPHNVDVALDGTVCGAFSVQQVARSA